MKQPQQFDPKNSFGKSFNDNLKTIQSTQKPLSIPKNMPTVSQIHKTRQSSQTTKKTFSMAIFITKTIGAFG